MNSNLPRSACRSSRRPWFVTVRNDGVASRTTARRQAHEHQYTCCEMTSKTVSCHDVAGDGFRQQFLTGDVNVAWGVDAETYLAAVDVHDRDGDVVADDNLFTQFPAENQHVATL